MTAEIVAFPRAVTPQTRKLVRKIIRQEMKAAEMPLTETAKNQRLRRERWEVWRRANAITKYWLRRLEFIDAISIVERLGFSDKTLQRQDTSHKARWQILESYCEAERKQILTPAPDTAAVNWKRSCMGRCSQIDLSKEHIEKVIAADMAFLSEHPTRRPRSIQQV